MGGWCLGKNWCSRSAETSSERFLGEKALGSSTVLKRSHSRYKEGETGWSRRVVREGHMERQIKGSWTARGGWIAEHKGVKGGEWNEREDLGQFHESRKENLLESTMKEGPTDFRSELVGV